MDIPEILRALDAQIAQLRQARELIAGSEPTPEAPPEPAKRRGRPPAPAKTEVTPAAAKRIMSDEGKARIAAAQKKRWAKSRKAAEAPVPAVSRKKTDPANKAVAKRDTAPAKRLTSAKKTPAPAKKAAAKETSRAAGKTPRPEANEPSIDTAPTAAVEETSADE